MDRVEYDFKVIINGRSLSRVIIDQRYRRKHTDLTDKVILSLIREIHGGHFSIEEERNGFQYFTVEPVMYRKKPYRLILLLCVQDDFLGVVNAFRVQRKKYE